MHIRSKSFLPAMLPVAIGVAIATATPAVADSVLDPYTPVEFTEYQVSDSNAYGNVYFTTPDGRACGILYNSGPAGCDAVPIDAPSGSNQVRVAVIEPAHFLSAANPTFSYPNAKILPEGHKITLQNTTCGIGYQGTVTCEVGDHAFTIAATYSELS
ncbi:hypothetical protein [Nocardia australiensis]|uniref:hypothetical protein n=1 Tax=Nocardia australiensis TaxID=2887191 RepID=UPI001D142619|nr:hypothetical protein [Nocardia australiensis]